MNRVGEHRGGGRRRNCSEGGITECLGGRKAWRAQEGG